MFALECDVDDRASDVVVSPKLITRPNTIVPSTFAHWSAIVSVMWAVSQKLITRPNTIVSDKFPR
jgi:hypothetical protein